jgi:hypothetical protein
MMHGEVMAPHLGKHSTYVQVSVSFEAAVLHKTFQFESFFKVNQGSSGVAQTLVIASQIVISNCLAPRVIL